MLSIPSNCDSGMKSILFINYCYFICLRNADGYFKNSMGKKKLSFSDNFKITGGKNAYLGMFPFNVQFLNLGGMCGGSIITKKSVLTAAHCFDYNKNVTEMKVFSNSRFAPDMKYVHDVWYFKVHEEYNLKSPFSNDIAVVMIRDEFKYNNYVRSVSLCNSEIWKTSNETFFVSGWGETKYGEEILKQDLRMTRLNLVPNDRCEAETRVKLTPEMFCLSGEGLRDTCRGDSGGGVVWMNMLVGIVSHGKGCMRKPSIYINVSQMALWVQEAVTQLKIKFCSEFYNSTFPKNIKKLMQSTKITQNSTSSSKNTTILQNSTNSLLSNVKKVNKMFFVNV